jgi:hypothetical protein
MSIPLGRNDGTGSGLSRRSFLKSGLAVAGLGLGGAALAGCSSDNVISGLTVSRK